MLLVQAQAYRQQYGFNAIFLCRSICTGRATTSIPAARTSSPRSSGSSSTPTTAGAREVEVWGDGSATREFLYVDDAAEGIVLATERYDGAEPVNLGAGFEISIRDLAEKIAALTGFTGHIDGTAASRTGSRADRSTYRGPRRCSDSGPRRPSTRA